MCITPYIYPLGGVSREILVLPRVGITRLYIIRSYTPYVRSRHHHSTTVLFTVGTWWTND
nr:MAG TPA: hypothetical protein [Bacteriophage sp.]